MTPGCRTPRSSSTRIGDSSTSTSWSASTGRPDRSEPPPGELSIGHFEAAVVRTTRRVQVTYPTTPGISGTARWGEQVDVRRVALESTSPRAVAAYIAKYATKSTDAFGRLDHRLHESDLVSLDLRPHLKRLVTTAWDLGVRPELEHLRLRQWAHTLGFRGHWLTKSQRYSTTLGALRAARAEWARTRRASADRPSAATAIKDWRYLGRGWDNQGDAWLARTAAAEAAEARKLARDARLAERGLRR
ncbi:MAG: replication initiator [Acidimicrobiia bacterium]